MAEEISVVDRVVSNGQGEMIQAAQRVIGMDSQGTVQSLFVIKANSSLIEIIEEFTFAVTHAKEMVKARIYRENKLKTQSKQKAAPSQGLEMIWLLEEEQCHVKPLELPLRQSG